MLADDLGLRETLQRLKLSSCLGVCGVKRLEAVDVGAGKPSEDNFMVGASYSHDPAMNAYGVAWHMP